MAESGNRQQGTRVFLMAGHDHTPVIHEHADAWHHHTADEGMPQHEHAGIVDAGAIMKWLVAIVVSLLVTIVALKMYFTHYTNQLRTDPIVGNETIASSDVANTARAHAESRLGTDGRSFQYTAADKKARTVQLPIDAAMRRTVEKYQQNDKKPTEK